MPPFAAVDLLHTDGSLNMGSIQVEAYYAPVGDFLVMPEVPNAPATLAEAAVIASNFTFKTGKCFKKMYITQDKGSVNDEIVGERDGKSFMNKLQAFHPGTKAEMLGFAALAANTGFIFIVVEADGQMRVIGSKAFPGKIDTGTITTSQTTAGLKGFTFEIGCASKTPAPIYTGTVALTPAA